MADDESVKKDNSRHFAIRASLAESTWDVVINPTSSNSLFQLHREFTVKTLVFAVIDFVVIFAALFATPIGTGGFIGVPVLLIGWLWLSYLLIHPTTTRLLGYSYIPAMINYLDKGYRHISTRSFASASPFIGISGLKGLLKDGRVVFSNNDIGCVVELVGNASLLMFDSARDNVLMNVRRFYSTVKPGVSFTYDNVSAPQRVVTQLKAKDQQLARLMVTKGSQNLQDLVRLQRLVLDNFVGKQFKSFHQYMVVRATNQMGLQDFLEWLQLQTSDTDSNNYLQSYRILTDNDEIEEYFRNVYTSNDLPENK